MGWTQVWVDGYKDLEKEISKRYVDFCIAGKQKYQKKAWMHGSPTVLSRFWKTSSKGLNALILK
jgi:hypothetical protein